MVLADGFYEWDKHRKPYGGVLKSEPFAMADIYAPGENERDPFTFAILTTVGNDVMRPVHEHMPVMLMPGHERLAGARRCNVLQPLSRRTHDRYPVSAFNETRNVLRKIVGRIPLY
jgi:putative SOS response-associated peptidase YedK